MRRLPRCGRQLRTDRPRTARRHPGGRGPRRGAGILRRARPRRGERGPATTRAVQLSQHGQPAGGRGRGADRRLPGGVRLAAPPRPGHASPRCGGTPSAPASSSRSPATCGCCAEDAQFTMAEVALGLVPDLGGTKRLVELVGYARALEICVTGRRVGAAEAATDRPGQRRRAGRGPRPGRRGALPAQVLAARRDAVVEIKALLAGAAGRQLRRRRRRPSGPPRSAASGTSSASASSPPPRWRQLRGSCGYRCPRTSAFGAGRNASSVRVVAGATYGSRSQRRIGGDRRWPTWAAWAASTAGA